MGFQNRYWIGCIVLSMGCATARFEEAMTTKNEQALASFLADYGADDDPEAVARTAKAIVELDGVHFAKAKAANRPAAYRAYIRDRRAERIVKAGPLAGRKFKSIKERIFTAKRMHDDVAFQDAQKNRGFGLLEALPAKALSGHRNTEAITEACRRRLIAIGGQIKGAPIDQWLDKCADNESVKTAFEWTAGRTRYTGSTYSAWMGLSKASIPKALVPNISAWIIAQESGWQLKNGNVGSLKDFIKRHPTVQAAAKLKLRHDVLLQPCPDEDPAACTLGDIAQKAAYLSASATYLGSCMTCSVRAALETRKPTVASELATLVGAQCKSSASEANKSCLSEAKAKKKECSAMQKAAKYRCKDKKEACKVTAKTMNRAFGAGASRLSPNCGVEYSTCMASEKVDIKKCTLESTKATSLCKETHSAAKAICEAQVKVAAGSTEAKCTAICEAHQNSLSSSCKADEKRTVKECRAMQSVQKGVCAAEKRDCGDSNRIQRLYNQSGSYQLQRSLKNCGSRYKSCVRGEKETMNECLAEAKSGECPGAKDTSSCIQACVEGTPPQGVDALIFGK